LGGTRCGLRVIEGKIDSSDKLGGTRCGLRVIEGKSENFPPCCCCGDVDEDMMIVLITSGYKWRTCSGTGG
jgi:hypothetical protein